MDLRLAEQLARELMAEYLPPTTRITLDPNNPPTLADTWLLSKIVTMEDRNMKHTDLSQQAQMELQLWALNDSIKGMKEDIDKAAAFIAFPPEDATTTDIQEAAEHLAMMESHLWWLQDQKMILKDKLFGWLYGCRKGAAVRALTPNEFREYKESQR